MSAPKVTRLIVSHPNKSLEEQSEELKNSDEDGEFRRMITAKLQQLKNGTNISRQHKQTNGRESQCKAEFNEDTELLKKCQTYSWK